MAPTLMPAEINLKKSISKAVAPLFNIAQTQSTDDDEIERRIHFLTMKNTSSSIELKKMGLGKRKKEHTR